MRGRLRCALLALSAPALMGATCGEDPNSINPCTRYDAPALTPPTGAVLLTDTVDTRVGWDSLVIRLEGYVPVRNLDRVAVFLRLPNGYETDEFLSLVDEDPQSLTTVHAATYLPIAEYGDPEARAALGWQTGVYGIKGLRVERLLEICFMSGESYEQVILRATDLGMTDTTFVFLID